MSTRSSTRLRDVRIKAEQAESSDSSKNPLKRKSAVSNPSTRQTRTIVKTEDGDLDESSLARLKIEADEYRQALEEEDNEATPSKKRTTARAKNSAATAATDRVKKEASDDKEAVKKSKFATKEPLGWKVTLDRLREFRLHNPAPVDTMGCERLAEVGDHIPPEVSRFQTLMALVLSSQTKDTVTSVAVRRLQKELKGGLTIQGVLDVPSEELNTIIGAVGFHNKKTIFMKQVAEICRRDYNGDIPDTPEGLIALPGVGPKMAYLTLQCAWNKNLGIGVDTHVHRISNRLGWVKTEKDGPEGTREALQSWLPKEHWREINHIMVGFGQVLCLPRGPMCGVCPVQERCPSSTVKTKRSKKEALKEEIQEERVEPFGEVEIHSPTVVKLEHDDDNVDKENDKSDPEPIIKEEQDEAGTSRFFGSAEDSEEHPQIKKEDDGSIVDLAAKHGMDKTNLDKEAADIEDLVT
ncbi:endonuclease III [Entomortierella parvispora]|uniref:Endonuclease III homolog n=1 Tax=Entomortierella parvispora TaxID=205924 RepID=A0A9P3LZW3_9FUNG|nr:endonuclease III [Entomortierella parvispora]